MQPEHQRRNLVIWYLSNLLGWAIGISGGLILASSYLLPWAEGNLSPSTYHELDDVIGIGFPLLALVVCVGLAQWLLFRRWHVKFDMYKWLAANVKGTFIACVILFMLGLVVGELQRPILDFLYGDHTTSSQTDLILKLIFIGLPLLGSIGTSVMVAIDILKWEWKKKNAIQTE